MAVSGIKGTGIGQVSIPSAEDFVRGQQQGILDILGSYTEGLMSGTGEKAGEFLSVPDFAPDPQTRLGQLFDVPGIAESAARGARIITGAPSVVTKTLGDVLSSPTESAIQDEIKRVESELSPFREEIRRQKSAATGQTNIGIGDEQEADAAGAQQAGMPTTPSLGSFTTADGEETRDQVDPTQAAGASEETIKDVTVTALQDYLDQARPGTKPKDYAEYIKEFSDATGLDVSGKPDKSTALMALGLSLMQNKAGKGFDVGKMLGAVGEAGEKALPEYQKAKSEARALRAKAGEYALGRRKEDEAKAQQRQFMYVVPKEGQGKTEADRLRNRMMQGSWIRVNALELNALDTNEAFNRKYEFLPSDAMANMKDLFKAPESPYMDKPISMDFLGGDLKAQVRIPKAGKEGLPSRYASSTDLLSVEDALIAKRSEIDSMDEKFTGFVDAFNRTDPNLPNKVASSLYGGLRGLGIIGVEDFGTAKELETDIQEQKRFLTYVQSRYAPQILQEAGKTISDADRQRVEAIVGDIKTLSLQDPAQLAAKVQQLHELVILSQRRALAQDFAKHNRMGGGTPIQALTKEQQARYESLKRKYDAQYGFTSSVNDEGKEVLTKSDEDE